MITNIPDKIIAEHAGWKAWKDGRNFNRVFEGIQIKENIVSGVIKQGRKKIRTVVKSNGQELEVSCTCPEFLKTHTFCQHAVALLLQSKEVKGMENAGELVNEPSVKTPTKNLRLEISLIKPLSELLTHKKPAPLKVCISKGEYIGESMQPFVESLGIKYEVGEHLIQLPSQYFAELLKLNVNNLFLMYDAQPLIGSLSPTRFPLSLVDRSGEQLSLSAQINEDWKLTSLENGFLILEHNGCYNIQYCNDEKLRGILTALLLEKTGVIHIKDYLEIEQKLENWFNLNAISQELQSLLLKQSPQISLDIKGTVNRIEAKATLRYGAEITLSENDGLQYLGLENDRFLITDTHVHSRVAKLLSDAGFESVGAGEFELDGQADIQEFVAYNVPRLKELKWEFKFLGSINAFVNNCILLSLSVAHDEFHESDDWVSFQYVFKTPEGKGMPSSEVQRLIQSGRQTFKLKNGKVALLSKKEYQLINEGLNDYPIKQVGHKYSIKKHHFFNFIKLSNNKSQLNENELVRNEFNSDYENILTKVFKILRPYQKDGFLWVLNKLLVQNAALIADDMGLGKTIQSIAIIDQLTQEKGGDTLIICPASLITNWAHEFEKFATHLNVKLLITGGDNKISSNDSNTVFITSYQKYLSDVAMHRENEYMLTLIDEASMIKNPEAKISKALFQQNSTYKIALTGTPMENTAGDLWSIFEFLSPRYLGKKAEFVDRFVKPLKQVGYTSELAGKRLRAKLSSHVIRRTKAVVLHELPPKTHRIEYCQPSVKQRELFTKIRSEYEALKDSNEASNIQILTTILRMRQVANDPSLINDEANEVSPKTKRVLEILTHAKASGAKVIIFSQFAQMLETLKDQLSDYKCSILTGSTRNRDEQINEFKKANGNEVFLISLKAGGYGLNLTEASIVIHYDPWWNPAVENQATDRAYRIGQSEPVTVFKLALQNSIDERIIKLQQSKISLQNLAVDSDTNPNMSGLNTNELESLI